MNFSGYFPIYRDIIAHTIDGRLSNNEALVLVWLTLLADKETGSYTINGPTLRSFLPGLTKGGAQRALETLQDKRYIYRAVTPRSPLVYPYWIQGFKPTAGERTKLQLELSEVFRTKDPSQLKWVERVPDTKPATKPDGELGTEPDGANYNETGNGKLENQKSKQSPLPIRMTTSATKPQCVTKNADSDTESHREAASDTVPQSTLTGGIGLKWSGSAGGYLDRSGGRVPKDKADRLISSLGLRQQGTEFFEKDSGIAVAWETAQNRISGNEGRIN